MALASLFLALAYIMPFLTGQIPEIGSMLCPMHIPVLLCGFICGPYWGLAVGFTAPLLRSLILGMPTPFPTAVCMAFELCVYGAVAGFIYNRLGRKKSSVFVSLLISMIAGRIVWGVAMLICTGINGTGFGFPAFIAGAFTNAIPGIIIQLILVPAIIMLLGNKIVSD